MKCDSEIPMEQHEEYEPPMIDEVGNFTALTRGSHAGSVADGISYYSE